MYSRRSFLVASSVGLTAAAPLAMSAQVCSVPFDRARYQQYIDRYCAFDTAFMDFYAEDVTMKMGPFETKGRQAIYDFFKPRRSNIKETIDVIFFASDASAMAVQVNGGFFCTGDIDNKDKLWDRPLKKGEVRRVRGVLLYTLDKSGKIKTIESPSLEVVHDWRTENS